MAQHALFAATFFKTASGRLLVRHEWWRAGFVAVVRLSGGAATIWPWVGCVRFGINICYDTRFAEAAAAVAGQGARLLLVPSQNMMRRASAERWKDLHHKIRVERVRETGMWLVSADVTGQRDAQRVGYGPTSVISPRGGVVARVPLMTTGMVVADIAAETDVRLYAKVRSSRCRVGERLERVRI